MSKKPKATKVTISPNPIQSKEVPVIQFPAKFSKETFPSEFGDSSVTINVVADAKPILISNFNYARGIINAYTALVHTGGYGHIEVGLHLVGQSLEELARMGMAQKVGYLLAGYNGELLPLVEKIVPEEGIVELDYAFGTFSVNRVVTYISEHSKGEPEWVTRDRRVFAKHFGMDLILTGTPLLLRPNLPSIENGMTGLDRVKAWVASAKATLDMTPEEAVAKISEKIFGNIVNRSTARTFAAMELAAAEGKPFVSELQTVPLYSGGEVDAEDLIGKTVRFWNGGIRMPANYPVTADNLQARLETVRRFKFTVELGN